MTHMLLGGPDVELNPRTLEAQGLRKRKLKQESQQNLIRFKYKTKKLVLEFSSGNGYPVNR